MHIMPDHPMKDSTGVIVLTRTIMQDGAPGIANNEDAAAKVLEEQYW